MATRDQKTEVFTLVFKRTFLHRNRHWIGPISCFLDRESALPILGWIGHHYLRILRSYELQLECVHHQSQIMAGFSLQWHFTGIAIA